MPLGAPGSPLAPRTTGPERDRMPASSPRPGPCVVVASADAALRLRLRASLSAMRWQVWEAAGGAAALAQLEGRTIDALLLDHWLPDLEVAEFAATLTALYPGLDVLRIGVGPVEGSAPSTRRHELLHALREAQAGMGQNHTSPDAAPAEGRPPPVVQAEFDFHAGKAQETEKETPPLDVLSKDVLPPDVLPPDVLAPDVLAPDVLPRDVLPRDVLQTDALPMDASPVPPAFASQPFVAIDGMIGSSAAMQNLARMVRLVAPRSATVLIEGETGTGKELVAQALHQLSPRAAKPLVVLNCAAIPESLLEAELFGHTRGAFTGAVAARAGRIEAAHGGSLFLDEIGEMPLALQSKMLRFLECGELQRIGDNEVLRVDVRVIAATHQPLEERAASGLFRLDLYHRLAVFPIDVPPLRDRMEDVPALADFFLAQLARTSPAKRLSPAALAQLLKHGWPGNVRELAHVLERATILAGDLPLLEPAHIRVRREVRS